jgi:hypothetical protein
VPKGQNVESVNCGAVVNKVADAAHVQASNIADASAAVLTPDARLLCEQSNTFLKVVRNSSGRTWPVILPPSCRTPNLRCCARRNLDAKRHCLSGKFAK